MIDSSDRHLAQLTINHPFSGAGTEGCHSKFKGRDPYFPCPSTILGLKCRKPTSLSLYALDRGGGAVASSVLTSAAANGGKVASFCSLESDVLVQSVAKRVSNKGIVRFGLSNYCA